MQKFIVKITSENISLIDDSRVECFLLDSAADTAFNRRFAETARKAGKLLLSCGDKAPELCRELGLDGVVVDLSKNEKPKAEFQFLRNFLGKDAVIGAVTRNRRHEAMVISEFEPDFLVFQAWNHMFTLAEFYFHLRLSQLFTINRLESQLSRHGRFYWQPFF